MTSSNITFDLAAKNIQTVIRIGVTGHCDIPNSKTVKLGVHVFLKLLASHLTHTPYNLVLMSSLAEGADRVVAEAARDWKDTNLTEPVRIEAVLPLPPFKYVKDFKTFESRKVFFKLMKETSDCFVPTGKGSRQDSYRRAGEYVVNHCDIMIAVLDPTRVGKRGGTAEITELAKTRGCLCWMINPLTGKSGFAVNKANILGELDCLNRYNSEKINSPTGQSFEIQFNRLNEEALKAGIPKSFLPTHNHPILSHYFRSNELSLKYRSLFLKAGVVFIGFHGYQYCLLLFK